MGLLDQFSGLGNLNEDQTQGLLAAAAQMLQQSGPSRTPTSFGQIAGGGMMAYQGTMADQKKRRQQEEEAKQMALYRGMQMRDMESDYKTQEATRARAASVQQHLSGWKPGAPQPGMAPQMPQPQLGAVPQSSFPGMPQPQEQGQSPAVAGNDPFQLRMSRAEHMRSGGFHGEADALEKDALQFQKKVKGWNEVNVSGKIQFAPFYEDGTHGQPVPMEVARKVQMVDSGQSNDAIDPYTGQKIASHGKKQTLESVASERTARAGHAVTMRGQNMVDSRQRDLNAITRQGNQTQIFNDPERGMILVDKSTGQARPATGGDGQPFRGEAAVKRESASNKLLPLLTQADGLIKGATGSYNGAAIDQIGRVFGGATNGADAIAKLKVVEGQLMMAQPRMEGPQSNTDVLLYRQMAGQIGDPTVPESMKASALSTIRALAEKYASPDAVAADKAASASGVRKYNPKTGKIE